MACGRHSALARCEDVRPGGLGAIVVAGRRAAFDTRRRRLPHALRVHRQGRRARGRRGGAARAVPVGSASPRRRLAIGGTPARACPARSVTGGDRRPLRRRRTPGARRTGPLAVARKAEARSRVRGHARRCRSSCASEWSRGGMGRLHLVKASSYCVMASSCATRAPRNCARSAGARRASITVRRAAFMVSRMTMRLRRSGDSVRGPSSLGSRGPRSGFGSAMRHPLHRLPSPTVRDVPTVRPPEQGLPEPGHRWRVRCRRAQADRVPWGRSPLGCCQGGAPGERLAWSATRIVCSP